MKLNLRSYETQARLSVALAIAGGLGALGGAFGVLYHFSWDHFLLSYDPRGARLPMIGGALFVALAASVAGFCVGLNSAGQRRNKQSRLSWIGFFMNAAVLALALMIAFFFLFTRNPIRQE